jgi:hypothetical protein
MIVPVIVWNTAARLSEGITSNWRLVQRRFRKGQVRVNRAQCLRRWTLR